MLPVIPPAVSVLLGKAYAALGYLLAAVGLAEVTKNLSASGQKEKMEQAALEKLAVRLGEKKDELEAVGKTLVNEETGGNWALPFDQARDFIAEFSAELKKEGSPLAAALENAGIKTTDGTNEARPATEVLTELFTKKIAPEQLDAIAKLAGELTHNFNIVKMIREGDKGLAPRLAASKAKVAERRRLEGLRALSAETDGQILSEEEKEDILMEKLQKLQKEAPPSAETTSSLSPVPADTAAKDRPGPAGTARSAADASFSGDIAPVLSAALGNLAGMLDQMQRIQARAILPFANPVDPAGRGLPPELYSMLEDIRERAGGSHTENHISVYPQQDRLPAWHEASSWESLARRTADAFTSGTLTG